VTRTNRPIRTIAFLSLLLALSACSTSMKTVKTLDDPAYRDSRYHNFLVVGVAADYNNRAQFERQLVSAIKAVGGTATAYYTVAGDNPPVNRAQLESVIDSGGFDAVLLTRVADQQSKVDVKTGAPDTKVVRESGNVFDLFRYDYEELNDPDTIEINTDISIVTELYETAGKNKIWAIETSSQSTDGAGILIDREVAAIMQQLKKDKLIGS
jgi:hypothetical protein